jgi:hypothetical protein
LNFLYRFSKNPQISDFVNLVQWEPNCCMWGCRYDEANSRFSQFCERRRGLGWRSGWGTALLVGGSRDRSPGDHWGFFSGASDSSMCPGVDSAFKNEYQDIPGGKDGRCVRVTTLPPSCAECLEFWSLNLPETPKATRPVVGLLYLYLTVSGKFD